MRWYASTFDDRWNDFIWLTDRCLFLFIAEIASSCAVCVFECAVRAEFRNNNFRWEWWVVSCAAICSRSFRLALCFICSFWWCGCRSRDWFSQLIGTNMWFQFVDSDTWGDELKLLNSVNVLHISWSRGGIECGSFRVHWLFIVYILFVVRICHISHRLVTAIGSDGIVFLSFLFR